MFDVLNYAMHGDPSFNKDPADKTKQSAKEGEKQG